MANHVDAAYTIFFTKIVPLYFHKNASVGLSKALQSSEANHMTEAEQRELISAYFEKVTDQDFVDLIHTLEVKSNLIKNWSHET